jgi:methionyl-tRNA synthetase
MDACDLRTGAEAAWELVATANLYIQQVAPWKLAKDERHAELDVALASLARALYRLAVITEPFVPGKAASILESLGVTGSARGWGSLERPPVGGAAASRPESLFPKPSKV